MPIKTQHRVSHPRPIALYYYEGPQAPHNPDNYHLRSRASGLKAAIRAASTKCMRGEAKRVEVYDVDSYLLAVVMFRKSDLIVHFSPLGKTTIQIEELR